MLKGKHRTSIRLLWKISRPESYNGHTAGIFLELRLTRTYLQHNFDVITISLTFLVPLKSASTVQQRLRQTRLFRARRKGIQGNFPRHFGKSFHKLFGGLLNLPTPLPQGSVGNFINCVVLELSLPRLWNALLARGRPGVWGRREGGGELDLALYHVPHSASSEQPAHRLVFWAALSIP